MATQVGRVQRHDDQVPYPRGDVVVAPGAQVGLACLVRLDAPDLDAVTVAVGYLGNAAHTTRAIPTSTAAATYT